MTTMAALFGPALGGLLSLLILLAAGSAPLPSVKFAVAGTAITYVLVFAMEAVVR